MIFNVLSDSMEMTVFNNKTPYFSPCGIHQLYLLCCFILMNSDWEVTESFAKPELKITSSHKYFIRARELNKIKIIKNQY